MKMVAYVVAAAALAAPVLLSGPCAARTAYQEWAQGRGAYVTSKDRLSTYQDDLRGLGLIPPPPGHYRHRRDPQPDYWDGDPPDE